MVRPARHAGARRAIVAAALLGLTLAGCSSTVPGAGALRLAPATGPAATRTAAAGTAVTRTSTATQETPTEVRPTSSPPHRTARSIGSAAPPTAPGPVTAAPFRYTVDPIDAALAARMHAVYPANCPVSPADLRDLHLTYLGFDGRAHTGEMVVAARVADDVVTAFRTLYEHRFEIDQMRLAVDFGGNDDASMAADNTSAFNCRPITGGGGWSEHSYGEAIDINPVQNPYLAGSTVLPAAGRAYLNRPDAPGVIHAGGVAVRAFAAIGWTWGGTWTSPVDLQHFSLSGR